MTDYRKAAWAAYKRKHGIRDQSLVRQKVLVRTLCRLLHTGNVVEEARFDWLRGLSGKMLRIDAYFPDFNLAVEYDGEQHFFPVSWMGQSPEQASISFELQKQRDDRKTQLLHQMGIRLVRFSYKERIDNLTYVQQKLILSGIHLAIGRQLTSSA